MCGSILDFCSVSLTHLSNHVIAKLLVIVAILIFGRPCPHLFSFQNFPGYFQMFVFPCKTYNQLVLVPKNMFLAFFVGMLLNL
jgi:hypothetical protein